MKISRRIVSMMLALILLGSCLSITAFADESPMVYGIGFVNTSGLKLRTAPSTQDAILAAALKDECVVVLGKEGDWYKVNYNLQVGYMYSSYLQVSQVENAELGYGSVLGSGVNVRSGPNTANPVVATVSSGSKCYILGLNQGWYKVMIDSTIGYIRSDYLQLTEAPYENQASANSPKYFRTGRSIAPLPAAATVAAAARVNVSAQAIMEKVKTCLGVRYLSGGASMSGFDCSGLVYYVLKELGMAPGRTPDEQYTMGSSVNKTNLQAGDIVFFAGTVGSGVSHVGIYAGNGQFIHAPNSSTVVSYSDLTTGYWSEHYYGARRVA